MEEEECVCEEGAPPWMATFSDMATLLLTFFVLLLSFANMDVQNFRVALGSVKEAFGVQFKVYGDIEAMSTTPVELSDTQSSPYIVDPGSLMAEALSEVQKYVSERGMRDKVAVIGTPRGIVLRMKDVVLFDVGSADLKEKGKPALDVIADLFERFDGTMAVEGHTDNRPISTSRYPSNWELSTARSTAVLRYLTVDKKLDTKRLGVAGYADVRPVLPNDSADHRAKNRRVEFVFDYETKVTDDGQAKKMPMFKIPFAQHTER